MSLQALRTCKQGAGYVLGRCSAPVYHVNVQQLSVIQSFAAEVHTPNSGTRNCWVTLTGLTGHLFKSAHAEQRGRTSSYNNIFCDRFSLHKLLHLIPASICPRCDRTLLGCVET
jgi:hypothetical protein